jgi:excisionase family DNA binding protein
MPRADLPESLQTIIQATAVATAEALLQRLQSQQTALSTPAGSPLLSVKEACRYLKLSRSELHRLEQAGVLKPIRFGRRVFYARAALDGFIRNGGAP